MVEKISNSLQSLDTVGNGAVVPVTDEVAAIAASVDTNAEYVELQVQDADLRATFDGADPDPESKRGFLLRKDQIITLDRNDALSMKLIQEAGSPASVYMESKAGSF